MAYQGRKLFYLVALSAAAMGSACMAQPLPGTYAYTVTPRSSYHKDGNGGGYAIEGDNVHFSTDSNGPTGFVAFGETISGMTVLVEARRNQQVHFACEFVKDAPTSAVVSASIGEMGGSRAGGGAERVNGTTTVVFSSDRLMSGTHRIYLRLSSVARVNFHSCQVRFSKKLIVTRGS